jgi:signal transduction histidine kinase
MLELELVGHATALDLVSRIQNAQGHIGQLLEEVRGYAAPVKLDRGWCRLSDIWREAWDTLAPQRKGRNANLCEDVCDIDLRALVDRFRLVQVFRNLFENSLAATVDPVAITVVVRLLGGAKNERISVRVRDNGPGMKLEERRRAFEPFFTTKPKGTGLGMAIAQRIIEAHGGMIQIVDRPSPGAEILVEFPRGEV